MSVTWHSVVEVKITAKTWGFGFGELVAEIIDLGQDASQSGLELSVSTWKACGKGWHGRIYLKLYTHVGAFAEVLAAAAAGLFARCSILVSRYNCRLLMSVRVVVGWLSVSRCSIFEEELAANAHGVFWSLHRMANGPADTHEVACNLVFWVRLSRSTTHLLSTSIDIRPVYTSTNCLWLSRTHPPLIHENFAIISSLESLRSTAMGGSRLPIPTLKMIYQALGSRERSPCLRRSGSRRIGSLRSTTDTAFCPSPGSNKAKVGPSTPLSCGLTLGNTSKEICPPMENLIPAISGGCTCLRRKEATRLLWIESGNRFWPSVKHAPNFSPKSFSICATNFFRTC